jgi:hypothetical protein
MVTNIEDKVKNINKKYYEMDLYFIGIEIGVLMTSRKASVKKKAIHICISSSRNLLKTTEIFFKVAEKDGVILNIEKRFFHIGLFLYIPMQEGRFNIHLMDLPSM